MSNRPIHPAGLWDRRAFLRSMCLGGLATFADPRAAFARVPGPSRLVFVLLRGGFDGLAAVVPVGDPAYERLRGTMAFPAGAVHALDGTFALAPGLEPLLSLWHAGELLPVHAMAIPFRTRSHFDGQAVLETGLSGPSGSADGWLNRLLRIMGGEAQGIAVAAGTPRSLAGDHPVLTWSPTELGVVGDGYLDRLHHLYQRDDALHSPFEAALQLQGLVSGMGDDLPSGSMRRGAPGGAPEAVLRATATFLRAPDGPNVAALEFGGWDTHANQGLMGGPLDRRLRAVAQGLVTFREEMGAAWEGTTVVVMTEFGRTAAPNGTGGTDHGTAGAGFVLGAGVAGGRVLSDWPGLGTRDLFEGRDLRPTLDTRALLKGICRGVFDLTAEQAGRIFPGSAGLPGLEGLLR